MSLKVVLISCLFTSGLSACQEPDRDPKARDTRLPEQAMRAGDQQHTGACGELPTGDALRSRLKEAAQQGEAGGFASGKFEWAAVVARDGTLCSIAVSSDDPAATWPGSQGIAKAKAFTANAFSS